jgi:hypothetical protein
MTEPVACCANCVNFRPSEGGLGICIADPPVPFASFQVIQGLDQKPRPQWFQTSAQPPVKPDGACMSRFSLAPARGPRAVPDTSRAAAPLSLIPR